MRLAFFGDVIGKSGRDGISDHLPGLKRDLGIIAALQLGALAFGVTRVVVLADNLTGELVALQHMAENAGARRRGEQLGRDLSCPREQRSGRGVLREGVGA